MVPRRLLFPIALAALASCFSSAQYDRAHEQRVAEINARYDQQKAEETKRWNDILAQVDEQRRFLIPIKDGAGYAPKDRVSASPVMLALEKVCDDAKAQADAKPPDEQPAFQQIAKDCYDRLFKEQYIPALATRYYEADFQWAGEQLKAYQVSGRGVGRRGSRRFRCGL